MALFFYNCCLQLTFENVRVQSVEVTATGIPRNELATFWQQSDVELSRGLDFVPRGSVFARFTHLQHTPFTYKIVVSKKQKKINDLTVKNVTVKYKI